MKKDIHCSFCEKHNDDVEKMIAGPKVFICDECVELSKSIINEQRDVNAIEKENPHAANLYVFLERQSGIFSERATLCSNELMMKVLSIDELSLNTAVHLLKKKKLLEIIPLNEELKVYLLNEKGIKKHYDEALKLYSIPANIFIEPSAKLKLFP